MIQIKNELFTTLLYLNQELEGSRYLETRLRMQKLTFLAQNFLQKLPQNIRFEYYADKFGPYSRELRANIELEEQSGIIETLEITTKKKGGEIEEEQETTSYIDRYDYRLSDFGIKIMKDRFKNYFIENKYIFYGLRNLSLLRTKILIGIVYFLFPDMAIKSKIKPIIKKIPENEIKMGIKVFFRTLPQELIFKIYDLNNNFSLYFPDIEKDLSFKIREIEKEKEIKIIRKVISKNFDLLRILEHY